MFERFTSEYVREYGWAIVLFLSCPAIIIGIPALAIITPSLLDSGRDRIHQQSFDSERWQSARETRRRDPVRLRMVADLVDGGTLVGLDRTSLDSLLGEPDDVPYFREYPLVYWLGVERSFQGVESEYLVLQFDSDGRVAFASHKVIRD